MDFSHVFDNVATMAMLAVFLLSFIGLAIYYGETYIKVGRYRYAKGKNKTDNKYTEVPPVSPLPAVSVVLTAHNDANWMKDNIVYLLEQDYPDFEVVVVDYLSTDDTEHVLKICADNYPNMKVVVFKEDVNMFQGKKYPLAIGIKEAKNDVILLTEPDCLPNNNFQWIREMMATFHPGTKIMIGYCGIAKGKGLLYILQQYENLTVNADMFRASLKGNTYSGNGRNMAYRRSFFFAKKGFASHYTEPYGADDLFVNQNAKGEECRVCIQPNAYVTTSAKSTFVEWHRQRRNASKVRRYHAFAERLQHSLYPHLVALFYLALVLLIVGNRFPWEILAGMAAIKIAWQVVAFAQLSERFEVKKICFFSPFLELYFLFANTILTITSLLKRK